MSLESRLAEHALDAHPIRAALALDRLGSERSLEMLAACSLRGAARVWPHLSPSLSAAALAGLDPARAARILDALTVDAAARALRGVERSARDALLARVETDRAKAVRRILSFPPGSAGSLMDPTVLALPQELTAGEAVERVREKPEHARYNVYVVDELQRLVGALNLREILLAPPDVVLGDRMIRNPHRISAEADRAGVLAHPGWKEVHTLPVVDAGGVYLGAIRYRTLRALESEDDARRTRDADAGAAFGEVIAAAAGGVLDALGGAAVEREGRSDGR